MLKEIKEKAEQTFRNHLTFLSQERIVEWVDLFSGDGILEFPYAPKGFPGKVQGKGELLEYMKKFPEHFKIEFKNLYFHPTANPNLLIAEFESDGVALSTNNPYLQKYISVVTTTDEGKFVRYVDYWNPLVAMESLGINVNEKGLSDHYLQNQE